MREGTAWCRNLFVKNYFVKGCIKRKSGRIWNLKQFITVKRFVLNRLTSYQQFKILCVYCVQQDVNPNLDSGQSLGYHELRIYLRSQAFVKYSLFSK
jgi:hypothetical protein